MYYKERGTAIIAALFVVGLVAAIAITMATRLSRDIRRTAWFQHSTQASLYAEGSIAWAVESLCRNSLHQKPDERVDRILPVSLPIHTIEHYTISTMIYDAQSYFNLHNLSPDDWALDFRQYDKITANSQYFLIVTQVEYDPQQWILYTMLQRIIQPEKVTISVLWQSQGGI